MAARIDYTICRKRPKKRRGAKDNFGYNKRTSLLTKTRNCFYKQ
jgi:hypothetical protein